MSDSPSFMSETTQITSINAFNNINRSDNVPFKVDVSSFSSLSISVSEINNNNNYNNSTKFMEPNKETPSKKTKTGFTSNFQFGGNLRTPLGEKNVNVAPQSKISAIGVGSPVIKNSPHLKVFGAQSRHAIQDFSSNSSPNKAQQSSATKTGFSALLARAKSNNNSNNSNSNNNINNNNMSNKKGESINFAENAKNENLPAKRETRKNNEQRHQDENRCLQTIQTVNTNEGGDYEYRKRRGLNGSASHTSNQKEKERPSLGCGFFKSPKAGDILGVGSQSCKPQVSKFTFFSCGGGKEIQKDSMLEMPRDTHDILNTSEYAKATLGRIFTGVEHVTVEEFCRDIDDEEGKNKGRVANNKEHLNYNTGEGTPRGVNSFGEDLENNSYTRSVASNNNANTTLNNISGFGKKRIFDKSFQSGLGDVVELKEIMDCLGLKGGGISNVSSINSTASQIERVSAGPNGSIRQGLTRTASALNFTNDRNITRDRRSLSRNGVRKTGVADVEEGRITERDHSLNKDVVSPFFSFYKKKYFCYVFYNQPEIFLHLEYIINNQTINALFLFDKKRIYSLVFYFLG